MAEPRTATTRLLDRLFDYAGLFPPAAQPMREAVASYARYRDCPQQALLNTFVVPVARLTEFGDALLATDRASISWRLSVLSSDWNVDQKAVCEFQQAENSAEIISVETRNLTDVRAIRQTIDAVYCELSGTSAVADLEAALHSLQQSGGCAKIRMGGLTPDAFPSCAAVARFLVACRRAGVPFKATAGLHHPLRSERPTTAAATAPMAVMHGFVNVLAAVSATLDGAAATEVAAILSQSQPTAFHDLWSTDARDIRAQFHSIGSCSFAEPVEDLQAMDWLPAA